MAEYVIQRAVGSGSPEYNPWARGIADPHEWVTLDTAAGESFRIRYYRDALPDADPPPPPGDFCALKRITRIVGDATVIVETTGSVALLEQLLLLARKERT